MGPLTPEEVQILQTLLVKQGGAGAGDTATPAQVGGQQAPATPGDTATPAQVGAQPMPGSQPPAQPGNGLTPEALATLQQLAGAQKQQAAPPPDPGAQYQQQAQRYNQQADAADQQAVAPYPQPQGAQQQAVSALRAGMESFGAYGAPGGYYGQEELRHQQYATQQQALAARAKELRGSAQQQQDLGQRAQYESGQLAETQRQRDLQQQQFNFTQKQANRPVMQKLTPEEMMIPTDPNTGQAVAPPVTAPAKPVIPSVKYDTGIPVSVIDSDKKEYPIGDPNMPAHLRPLADSASKADQTRNQRQLDAAEKSQEATAANIQTSSDVRATAAENAAKAKTKANYDESVKSYTAMVGLARQGTYASDQAMADQFFNIIKPGSGARMNEASVARLLTPGPLADKLTVWAQKLGKGQPLDPAARQDMLSAAEVVMHSKQPTDDTGAAAPTGPASGPLAVKPGGAVERLLRGQ